MFNVVGSLLNKNANASPVPYAAPGRYIIPALSGRSDNEVYMRAMGTAGTIFQIVSLLSSASATPQWRLYRKPKADGRQRYTTGDRGSDQRTEVLQHQALNVWNNPNPFTTGVNFREAGWQHMELTGEQWWVVVRDSRATFPTGLWLVRPDRMEPVPSAEKYIAGYVYTGPSGERVPLQPEEVILTKYPNPLDPYRGLGPVQSVLVDIDAMKYGSEWNRNFFINGAVPGGVVTVPGNMSDDEFDQFSTRWRESHQGVSRSHRVAILEGGATWVPTQMSIKDMDFSNLRNVSRDVLREAWGIHKSMLGNADDVNRCHDDQTEVLTNGGWKPFEKVEDADLIATVNPATRRIEYHAPIHRFAYDYHGDMVRIVNDVIDVKVTPNHTMLYATPRLPDVWRTCRADQLPSRFLVQTAPDAEDCADQQWFDLPAVEYDNGHYGRGGSERLPMDAWLEFLGWVISEGGILSEERAGNRYVMTLAQKKYPQRIRDCLAQLPFSAYEYFDEGGQIARWNITGKGLITWLREHVGTNCQDKRIPRWCFNLSLRQRRILFDAMMAGDGSRDPRPGRSNCYYATSSPGLADDVLEFVFRLGCRANMASHHDGRSARAPMYYIHITDRPASWVTGSNNVSTERYDGKVYSLEVPNHIYVTRRNGRIAIHGNSNAQTAEEVFGRWKIIPRLDRLRDTLNNQFLPMFGSTGENVEWDYVNPLPDDREADNAELTAKTTAYAALISANVNPDDAAEVVGLPRMRHIIQVPAATPTTGAGELEQADDSSGEPTEDDNPVENQVRSSIHARTLTAITAATGDSGPTPPAQGPNQPDLSRVDAQWKSATDNVVADYQSQILPAQQQQLQQQIREHVDAAELAALGTLAVDTVAAKALLLAAMVAFAVVAAREASREADEQGASVPPKTPDSSELETIAAVAVALMASELAVSAGREAMRLAVPGVGGQQVADQVGQFLQGLSEAGPRGHLAGAMSAAQNRARHATFTQHGAPRGQLRAVEVLDSATCDNCEEIDGTVFGDTDDPDAVAEAFAAYPMGGYTLCEGRERCRGTLFVDYDVGPDSDNPGDDLTAMLKKLVNLLEPEPAHINGHHHEKART
ncbi:phage portal protein [Catenulispora acidiphila]|nr:phage portal protein [Catenulispora acidiphila]